ncbi:hypothetical protein GOP47_0030476 [Adiantum capillus-veneris]|nr:hypothetical protein GOP47_0030476 [Adiantum capillus-veneris]
MEDSNETAKLVIYVAETGQSFELNCPSGTLVQLVQTCLTSLTSVPVSDQLLICEDMRLESQRSLESYRLPAEGRHVFLYNRAHLLADVPPPPPEQIQVKELILPSPPSAPASGHPLDKASDPAIKALPSYERQFRFHFDKGLAIFNGTHDRFEICRRLLHEKQVQSMAIDAAKRNMDHHYKMIDQMYSDFMKLFNRQQKQHADILSNLDRDLDHLRKCKLHPNLIADGRKTLVDCVETSDLDKQAQFCASSHKQLQGKVMQLKAVFLQLQKNVESFSHLVPSVDVHDSERALTDHASVVDEEKTIMQSLSKDMNTVKKLVDDCVTSSLSMSMRPHDAVSALGPMYHVHVNSHLPKMDHCYQRIEKLLESFVAKKHEMGCCVHTCMQRVAALQSSIRDVRNQLAAFREALSRQEEVFKDLKLVRQIGPAYRACLAEVVRRKASMKLYMGQAGQLAERMARIREAEIVRREDFLRNRGSSLPREILMSLGLLGAPSQCVIKIEPYDGDLLDIDIMDLEKYAPEWLFGGHSKGSLASSCRSLEQGITDSLVTAELEMGADGGIDEEISGTSKLEVENAWLKAELASKLALSCSFDSEFEGLAANERDLRRARSLASQKTAEALALKDDYARHLQSSLKTSQQQCHAYERRIRELEQRLVDQHDQFRKVASDDANNSTADKSEVSGVTGEGRLPNEDVLAEPMDDGVNSALQSDEPVRCYEEGGDESMVGATAPHDTAMSERPDLHEMDGKVVVAHGADMEKQVAVPGEADCAVQTVKMCNCQEALPEDKQLLSLQEVFLQKTKYCIAVEEKLQIALSDADCVRKELQEKAGLLRECQFNCAELETSLHQAREESRIKQCSLDRKATEYNTLRTSSVRLRGLLERLRHCVSASTGGGTELAESLRALTVALVSNEGGDDGTADFCVCVKGLAERVGKLAQQQADLLEHCSLVETSKGQLATELESKVEMLKNQYAKRKLDKQVNKQKICYTRFQVHELAMFSINGSGFYEAINRGCPNYYLSDESVALFLQNLRERPQYIIGQIVHIERNVVRPLVPPNQMINSFTDISSTAAGNNPYGLPYGTVYFVVTLAMVPDRLPCLPMSSGSAT